MSPIQYRFTSQVRIIFRSFDDGTAYQPQSDERGINIVELCKEFVASFYALARDIQNDTNTDVPFEQIRATLKKFCIALRVRHVRHGFGSDEMDAVKAQMTAIGRSILTCLSSMGELILIPLQHDIEPFLSWMFSTDKMMIYNIMCSADSDMFTLLRRYDGLYKTLVSSVISDLENPEMFDVLCRLLTACPDLACNDAALQWLLNEALAYPTDKSLKELVSLTEVLSSVSASYGQLSRSQIVAVINALQRLAFIHPRLYPRIRTSLRLAQKSIRCKIPVAIAYSSPDAENDIIAPVTHHEPNSIIKPALIIAEEDDMLLLVDEEPDK
jgi:hypothetical protein